MKRNFDQLFYLPYHVGTKMYSYKIKLVIKPDVKCKITNFKSLKLTHLHNRVTTIHNVCNVRAKINKSLLLKKLIIVITTKK